MRDDSFMEFAGYRNYVMESKIAECMEQAQSGAEEISVDRGDLTDYEADFVAAEVRRRLGAD